MGGPAAGDRVCFDGRTVSEYEVLATDDQSGLMWVRPPGGRPLTTEMSDRWVPCAPRPVLPDVWLIASKSGDTVGYQSADEAAKAVTDDALAVIHVAASDGAVSVAWVVDGKPVDPGDMQSATL